MTIHTITAQLKIEVPDDVRINDVNDYIEETLKLRLDPEIIEIQRIDQGFLVLMVGTPENGFKLIGPFDTQDAAQEHGDVDGDTDWWTFEVTAP